MVLNRQKNSVFIASCLLFVFVSFTWLYEDYSYKKRFDRINKGASLLGYALWHMDKKASIQELSHLIKVENLPYAELKHSDGNTFVSVANQELKYSAIDDFFSKIGLLKNNPVHIEIQWDKNTIGVLQTSWRNRNFYIYINISLFLAAIWIISKYHFSLVESHDLLQKEVKVRILAEKELKKHRTYLEAMVDNRTFDLKRSNLELKSEITERKRAEDEVRRLNKKLEHLVEERTKQYVEANKSLHESLENLKHTQHQLVQSEKMASLGSLVAGVAHEINTPLGVGVTAASFLEDKTQKFIYDISKTTEISGDLKKYLDLTMEATSMILTNLNRAAELINSFKQVAVDRSSEKRRMFDFSENIEELITSLNPRFKRTSHKINIACPDQLVIDNYPGVFSQIFTNLIMNSIIHGFDDINEGCINLTVSRNGNDMLHIYYEDNGLGMDEETLQRIYDPFFTTKRNTKGGSGLGMHIVYNLIVQTLGGKIDCTSSPGRGTAFTIQTPLSPPEKETSANGTRPS